MVLLYFINLYLSLYPVNLLISSYNENEREHLVYYTNRSDIDMLATMSIHIDRNIHILFILRKLFLIGQYMSVLCVSDIIKSV